MKNIRLLFSAVAILLVGTLSAQHFTVSDEGSSVKFKIKNFGVTVGGSFTGLQGSIQFDPAKLNTCLFEASVESNSVNTGIGARDNHLRKQEYFAVKEFPKIGLKSTRIIATTKEGWLYFYGQLTIKNITKEISFPFQANELNGGFLFTGEFKINRRDFGVGGNSISLADNLTVSLSVFAKKS